MKKDFFNDRRGIIIIVTLVMIIMLTMVALDLHETTLRTYERIRNENNSFQADSFAKSAMEVMLLKLNEHDVGYNLEKVTCNYGTYASEQPANTSELCEHFDGFLVKHPETGEDRNAFFTMEVKGRADSDEKLKNGSKCWGSKGDFSNKCYIVPFAGTGSAGDPVRCKMYKPVFEGTPEGNMPNSQNVDKYLIGVDDNFPDLDQLNYSCNWGKLALGHSDMDRIAIPLYYEDYTENAGPGNIVNPFEAEPGFMSTKANNLILRVRTPCLPCVYDEKDVVPFPKINRLCKKGQDDTVCNDSDRYKLDDGGVGTKYDLPSEGNDVVVQWRLYGEEDDGSNDVCGVVAVPEQKSKILDPKNPEKYYGSAIYEFSINYQKVKNYYVLDITEELGHDICSDPKLKDEEKRKDIDEYLNGLDQPILTLSVIASLWDEYDRPIPYLEYQVLTDYPVANPEMKIETSSSLDGMGSKKIMYKDVPVSVMDFAVQN